MRRSCLIVALWVVAVAWAGSAAPTTAGGRNLSHLGPAAAAAAPSSAALASGQGEVRQVRVVAKKYAYEPARIEVQQDDLVKITFVAEDIPHSFTLDEYRISKRARPGQPVVFEFRADQPGRFVFYCNLAADDGCREMRGELIVNRR